MRSEKEIEELVELLFKDCCFDPVHMDEQFCKGQFRSALIGTDDEMYARIKQMYMPGQLTCGPQHRSEKPAGGGSTPPPGTNCCKAASSAQDAR